MEPYRVWLRSKPGMWERYDGYVDVHAPDEEAAVDYAVAKLQRTSFPDRSRDAWIVERVEKT